MFTASTTDYYNHSVAFGFWSPYLAEPRPPVVQASDGDYQELVLVKWFVEGDRTGPPVSSDMVTIHRNDYVLTTLPLSQTQYLDYNVFPGEYYSYGVTVGNDMGTCHRDDNVGFLNPNGVITGHVETPSGNSVPDTKVMLTPNLGQSAFFDGSSYIYYFDDAGSVNKQFDAFHGNYTLETWFRSVHTEQQTIFAAVDSGTANHYILLELTSEGKVRWQHSAEAGGEGHSIETFYSFTQSGDESDWHHVAAVFDSGEMRMYVDGAIVGETEGASPIANDAEIILAKRSPISPHLYFNGRLDDFRIWSVAREWEDIRKYMDLTLSGEENGLSAYWKFDEVEGETIFDMTDADIDGNICGVEHDDFIAPVFVGAITDSVGNYVIRGIYYGSGQTFTVTPSKESSIGRAIEFNGSNECILFENQRVEVADYTFEGWFKSSTESEQSIFSAVNPADDSPRFSVKLNASGQVEFQHFGTIITSSQSYHNELWHHVAVSHNDTLDLAILYVDGENVGQAEATENIPDMSEIVIARQSPLIAEQYFDGLLDEFRLWDLARTSEQVSGTMGQSLEGDNYGLLHYWRMNEGTDLLISDATINTVTGAIQGNEDCWTKDIPLNEVYHHYYEPESRQATLNNSNTSIDLVNFTDISMIPISGYVRYENTSCFQDGVEIRLNGMSQIPPILTDSNGKFVLEIEPGSTNDVLTPHYSDHEFIPSLVELPLISRPISGLYFNDTKSFDLEGIVAGGSCEYPITPAQGSIAVTVSAVNSCIEVSAQPHELTGMYEMTDLPPLIYTMTLAHPDPSVDGFFNADTITMERADREREFIYRSPPEVWFSELPESKYEVEEYPLIIEQRQLYQAAFQMFEPYINHAADDTNRCMIQHFDMEVFDNISDTTYTSQLSGEGTPHIQFTAKNVNMLDGGDYPFQQNLQVVVTDTLGRNASANLWALVEGDEKVPGVNFSTTTSKMPWFVLRVPPGDGSATYFSTDEAICNTTSWHMTQDASLFMNNTVHMGSDIQIVATAGMGVQVGTITESGTKLDFGANFSLEESVSYNNSSTECLTTSETYSTSGDGLVGDEATVFIGGGYTVDLGLARYIYYDTEAAVVAIDTVITKQTTGLHSTYLHTRHYIENVFMPDLLMLYELEGDQSHLDNYNYWQAILDADAAAVASAVTNDSLMVGLDGEESSNISFDAGAALEYSYATDKTSSSEWETDFALATEFFVETGFDIMGNGWDMQAGTTLRIGGGEGGSTEESHSRTIGFVLDDDDQGDGFAFSVKQDPTWGMPVFELIGGQSSCPHEPGSVARETVQISIDENLQSDIPPDDAAVFSLFLGNNSGTGEDMTYQLRVDNASNSDGAIILVNGVNIENALAFDVPAGQVVEATMAVYRGPEAYEYDDLTVIFESQCDGTIAESVNFSVHYLTPCTETEIVIPADEWVISEAYEGSTVAVTVAGFDRSSENLERIQLLYRSEGDWIPTDEIAKADLTEDYVILTWNIAPSIVIDGEYQLRASADCGIGMAAGGSNIVSGIIDRAAPQVLGLPSPSDGILNPDDVISIQFNEDLECGAISLGNGDLQLTNTVWGEDVDFEYTCGNGIIVLDLDILQNIFYENLTFRATVNNIQDLVGNTTAELTQWEFYVNRNPIAWVGTDIENIEIYVDEEYSTNRILLNNGGSARSYNIIGGREDENPIGEFLPHPDWLQIYPASGTLTPGSSQNIEISLSEGLNFGQFDASIYAAGSMGNEALAVSIRKLCYPPDWSVNSFDFEYSMNITANLLTEGELSSDLHDLVAVFVDDEIRGVGEIFHVSELDDIPNLHTYFVFMSVYSDIYSGEALEMRVWDASECTTLGWVDEEYVFEANSILGIPASPVSISATNQILSARALTHGWNWMSLNLESANMSLNTLTSDMNLAADDLVKSQTSFSMYVPDFGWAGSLMELENEKMYQFKLANPDTLRMVGYAVDPELDTIQVNTGWNWISYLPQISYSVDWALAALNAQSGDLVKSQSNFAIFMEGYGWIGSLQYMHPGNGYLLNTMLASELCYPFSDEGIAKNPVADFSPKLNPNSPDWQVEARNFEHNMSMVATLKLDGRRSENPFDMLAAFVGDECRGVAQPVYIETLGEYLLFLSITGSDGEQLEFRAFRTSDQREMFVNQRVEFQSNKLLGELNAPTTVRARSFPNGNRNQVPSEFMLGQNFPNPFNPLTTIPYAIAEASFVRIEILNLAGQKLCTIFEGQQSPGWYSQNWDGHNAIGQALPSGIYFSKMEAGEFRAIRKIVLMK